MRQKYKSWVFINIGYYNIKCIRYKIKNQKRTKVIWFDFRSNWLPLLDSNKKTDFSTHTLIIFLDKSFKTEPQMNGHSIWNLFFPFISKIFIKLLLKFSAVRIYNHLFCQPHSDRRLPNLNTRKQNETTNPFGLVVSFLAPPVGLEPTTSRLTVECSTGWAKEEYLIFVH